MPKARMVATDIGQNYRIAQLPYEPHDAQKFYTWMIGKADREGRLPGDAKLLTKIVAPYCDYSIEEVEDWLSQMENLKDDETGYGLIERYVINGHQYIWIPGWENWQPPSYRIKEAPSKIPPPNIKLKTKSKTIKKTKPEFHPYKISISDEILDEKLAKKVQYYEQNIGIITPAVFDLIKETDNDPEGWFEKATDEAVFQNKRNIKYILAILKNWREKGVTTNGKDKGHHRQLPEKYTNPEDL